MILPKMLPIIMCFLMFHYDPSSHLWQRTKQLADSGVPFQYGTPWLFQPPGTIHCADGPNEQGCPWMVGLVHGNILDGLVINKLSGYMFQVQISGTTIPFPEAYDGDMNPFGKYHI